MTNRCGSTLDWTSYDLPAVIRKGTQSATFSYGVDRARYKQVDTGATSETIYYVGSLFEKHVAGSSTKYRHYLPFRGETPIMVDRLPDTTTTMSFLHRDAQGSVSEVTNASGALVDSFAFDPWGLRRNATTWAPLADPFGGTQLTEDGYTGHEHLDPVGLIHMNGRVQDPKIGRFISPDPIVQSPYYSQSHNRYSYVWNGPATLVDPSGFEDIPFVCQGSIASQSPICQSHHIDCIGCTLPGTIFTPDPSDTPPNRNSASPSPSPAGEPGPDLTAIRQSQGREPGFYPVEPKWFEGVPVLEGAIIGFGNQLSLFDRFEGYRVNPFTGHMPDAGELRDADLFTFLDIATVGFGSFERSAAKGINFFRGLGQAKHRALLRGQTNSKSTRARVSSRIRTESRFSTIP